MGRTPISKTLFDRIWERHVVEERPGEPALLYIDLHLVHQAAQAFESLRLIGRRGRRADLTIATMDHNVPTEFGRSATRWRRRSSTAGRQLFGVRRSAERDRQRPEGIVHVTGPELGVTQPGMTIVCGDSHTSTHGAFGALVPSRLDGQARPRTQTVNQPGREDDAGSVLRRTPYGEHREDTALGATARSSSTPAPVTQLSLLGRRSGARWRAG